MWWCGCVVLFSYMIEEYCVVYIIAIMDVLIVVIVVTVNIDVVVWNMKQVV